MEKNRIIVKRNTVFFMETIYSPFPLYTGTRAEIFRVDIWWNTLPHDKIDHKAGLGLDLLKNANAIPSLSYL
ncbi:MAG: hypothetical protein M0Z61_15425 [Nitrospiraceae bacterium]|nr:hypothetical protein [Nitrospiraceae bacterium]